MTRRAIILGLLGASFVCGFDYFNDNILLQTLFIGNNMPASVYGGLILFILLVNPIIFRKKAGRRFTGKELAVALTLTLSACVIPESGLLRSFTCSLIMPHHFAKTDPGWKEQKVMDLVPKNMLVDPTPNDSLILGGFIQGLGTGDKHIWPNKVPWGAWLRPCAFWIPLILTLWIALIALAVVIHKQWASHEQLPYPIAAFANSLLPEEGASVGAVFKKPSFWISTGIVFLLNVNNYACLWFPQYLVTIPRHVDFSSLKDLLPTFIDGGGEDLLMPTFYMTPVGIAFLLASDVSFSLGIGPFLWCWLCGFLGLYGITLTGTLEGGSGYTELKAMTFLLFGANLGVFLSILYTGRHYYLNVCRKGLGFSSTDHIESEIVWGFRVFIFALLCFVGQLVFLAGLELQISLMYTAILVLFYVVMSRVLAETGLFYIQPFFFPCVVIWGILGAKALGPQTMMTMFILTMIILIDPRESLMPFMVNSFKVLDVHKAPIGKTAMWSVVAIVLGITIALPTCLWFQYDRGHSRWDWWACDAVPKMPFENVVKIQQKLEGQDSLEQSKAVSGLDRYKYFSPNKTCMISLACGLVAVLFLTAGRLRFTRWPLHPILLLTWATEPLMRMCGAFLLGWMIKILVVKYGGRGAYQKVKPTILGLIAGETLGIVFPIAVGLVYYLLTGHQPKAFWVLPG